MHDAARRIAVRNLGFCIIVASAFAVLWTEGVAGQDVQIVAGDTVLLTVSEHPDLGGRFVVNAFGDLALPRAGVVRAAGLRPGELAARVRQIHEKYLGDVGVWSSCRVRW